MTPGWRKVDWKGDTKVQGFIGQVIAVEQEGELRPFASLDHLERWAATNPETLHEVLRIHRTVYDSWRDKTGGVYINKAAP